MKSRALPLALLVVFAMTLAAAGQASPDGKNPQPASSNPVPTYTGPSTTSAESLDLTPDDSGKLSQQQMQALIRVAAQHYRENYRKLRDYTYIERDVEHKLDGKGQVKSTEIRTYELMQLYGEPVERLIEKDDKPLNEKDAAKEEEKINRLAEKRKNESEEDRQKRQAQEDKAREKGREFVNEVADAYNFRLVGTEILNAREVWIIDGEPRPDFRPKLKEAEMLGKIRGRVWIDKSDIQLAKFEIEAIDTLSFGWVLARIHPGTNFTFEQTRINDEVWLPLRYHGKLDMRVALFRKDEELAEGSYHDYKKFRTSSRIVSVGEAK